MSSLTQAAAGLGIAVVGAAIALFLQFKGVISFSGPHKLQVTGDPPVTVSDGSLHAHSYKGWVGDNDGDTTIRPGPPDGTLSQTCTDSSGTTVTTSLWTDDDMTHIIAPGATVTIIHDSADASSADKAGIDITLPNGKGALTITTREGSFYKGKGKRHNREHSRPGEVESIAISNPSYTWYPQNPKDPHFTLLFCYE